MRMMLKARMETSAANEAVRDGSLPKALGEVMEMLQPEAAYFGPEGGCRTAFIVFDMADPSELPKVTERFFQTVNAKVDVFPVMDRADLEKGVSQLSQPS